MSPAHDGREHVEARVHARRGPPTHGRSVPPTQVGPTALRPGFWAPVWPVQVQEVVRESGPRRWGGSIPWTPRPSSRGGPSQPLRLCDSSRAPCQRSREADQPDAISACQSRRRGRSRTARTRRADAPASHVHTHKHTHTHTCAHTHTRAAHAHTNTHSTRARARHENRARGRAGKGGAERRVFLRRSRRKPALGCGACGACGASEASEAAGACGAAAVRAVE